MKELQMFLTYINPPIPLTNFLLKAHMKELDAWQDLVGGKNSIKEIVSAIPVFSSQIQSSNFFFDTCMET